MCIRDRVGIARTLLKNPPILLLDEATSALDAGTENDIQVTLQGAAKERTVIVIAHRLSTIADADHILVLHDGQVCEYGTHNQLVAAGGRYSMLWQRQTAEKSA